MCTFNTTMFSVIDSKKARGRGGGGAVAITYEVKRVPEL